ncbi:hypothetical protein PIROE2DRAFT_9750 [Piromyces sp. E2]|nr:hypothetical protein PIROE2DRAFT_9750 [Piromyces sp. E2]|eukprot:OUM63678.1 hypothetical protein PIROE2DRAFT_9750 [Piromyces sp. E2]
MNNNIEKEIILEECINKILAQSDNKKIDDKNLNNISKVCKNWYFLSQNNSIWRNLYEKKWGSVAFVEEKLCQYYFYLTEFQKELNLKKVNCNFQFLEILNLLENLRLKKSNIYSKESVHEAKLRNNKEIIYNYESISGLWRAIYYLHIKLDFNWINKNYFIDNMISHTDSIYCLQYDDEKIISGSRDKTIKIWDIKTNECIKTLYGHTGSILSLQFDNNYLVTGSSDNTIIIWNIKNFEIIKRITKHNDSVLSVKFNKKYLVSSSKDHTICIWDIQTGNFIKNLSENTAVANAIQIKKILLTIQFDGEKIVSGSYDRTIKVWDFKTRQLLFSLNGHISKIFCLQFTDSKIISCSDDKHIIKWDFSRDILNIFP